MVATKPVDFRKGAEGLAALVRETMGADPLASISKALIPLTAAEWALWVPRYVAPPDAKQPVDI